MKPILILLLTALACLAADEDQPTPQEAEPVNPPAEVATIVTMDFMFTSVPREHAMKLKKAFQSDPEKAAKELEQFVSDGKAEILAAPLIHTNSGTQAVSEDTTEESYATEFDPPIIVVGEKVEKPPIKPGLEIGGIPANFEIRNIGYTVQAEPKVVAGTDEIAFDYSLQHVSLAGKRTISIEKQPGSVKVSIEQPVFQGSKASGQERLKPGVPALLAVFRMPNDEKRFEFVTVTVHRREGK